MDVYMWIVLIGCFIVLAWCLLEASGYNEWRKRKRANELSDFLFKLHEAELEARNLIEPLDENTIMADTNRGAGMTVAELIEELKKMPQNMNVYMYIYGEEKEVEHVDESEAFGLFKCVELS